MKGKSEPTERSRQEAMRDGPGGGKGTSGKKRRGEKRTGKANPNKSARDGSKEGTGEKEEEGRGVEGIPEEKGEM